MVQLNQKINSNIGYFRIDIAEVRRKVIVATDRTPKFTYVELHNTATKPLAAEFLRNVIKILPYKIHTVLTDNGIQFTNLKVRFSTHRVCEENRSSN